MDTSLQQLYAARDYLVPFVGTGVSIQASGSQSATWPGLLRDGIKECATFCSDLPSEWHQTMVDRLDCADLFTYLAIAEEIHRRLEAENHFKIWLSRIGRTIQLKDRTVLDPLLAMSNLVVTTNYDTLVEQAFKADGVDPETVEIGDFATFRANSLNKQPAVLHIHGSVAGEIVLSAGQYQTISLNDAAQKIQEIVFGSKQFLFVGVGEGLSDPNVGNALDEIAKHIDKATSPNFLLVRGSELSAARKAHRDRPIVPVAYGSNYEDLGPFLSDLEAGEQREVPQDPRAFEEPVVTVRTGPLNIASFAEDRLEDLFEAIRKAERAVNQITNRMEQPKGIDKMRPSDQLEILKQQVASIQNPLGRLVRETAAISDNAELTEAELSKLAAGAGVPNIVLTDLQQVSAPLSLVSAAARSLVRKAAERAKACQEYKDPEETLRIVAATVEDAYGEISDLIEQLQDPDSPSLAGESSLNKAAGRYN